MKITSRSCSFCNLILTRTTKLFSDLNITVDRTCENIFELSRYDELPDLEDYHPSDTKDSLTLLKENGLDKSKDNLPIPVTTNKPKKIKSKYLMAKSFL